MPKKISSTILNYLGVSKDTADGKKIVRYLTRYIVSHVGQVDIFDKDHGLLRTAFITMSIRKDLLEHFTLWLDDFDKPMILGKISLFVMKRNSQGNLSWYGYVKEVFFGSLFYGYGNSRTAIEKVYVDDLDSFKKDRFYGVGTALMQLAVEMSLKSNCNGRVMLYSMGNSPGFYFKKGFRIANAKEGNKKLKRRLKKAALNNKQPKTEDLNGFMYLAKSAITLWKKTISQKPLLKFA